MLNRFRNAAPWLSLVGLMLALVGVLWDARLHLSMSMLAERGGLSGPAGSAHGLFALGMALTVMGAVMFLLGRTAGSGWPARLGAGLASMLVIALGVSAGAAGVRAGMVGGAHRHVDPAVAWALATQEQRGAAKHLVEQTAAGTMRLQDLETALAEGYAQSTAWTRGTWGHAHFHSKTYSRDGRTLDTTRPEGLVYYRDQSGDTRLLGALYLAMKGTTISPGGPITAWHSHANLCVSNANGMVVPVVDARRCPGSATLLGDSIEMLHVWTFENPDGQFADVLTPAAIARLRGQ
ncbi:MAG: hypothetical protein U0821_27145 [Chloroflexota bacterium]